MPAIAPLLLALATVLLATSAPEGPPRRIEWQPDLANAKAAAARDQKVLLIAVNMDGEAANDRMVKKIYQDKKIVELAQNTVNILASAQLHTRGSRTCARHGSVTCAQHQACETDVRSAKLLVASEDGWVIAPQHVFVGPDGKILLSVLYEVTAAELEWCLVTAIRTVDSDFAWTLSGGAKPPQRLVTGGIAAPPPVPTRPTRVETEELLDKLKRNILRGQERYDTRRRVMTSGEPAAIDFVRAMIRTGNTSKKAGATDTRPGFLHMIGNFSPPSYWKLVAEFANSGEEPIRRSAVVALEQLAAPESVNTIRAALRREKVKTIAKNLLRALGSAGAADKRVRTELLKRSAAEKDLLLKANAIVALGYLVSGDDVNDALRGFYGAGQPDEVRIAAVCAMAMTRAPEWKTFLENEEKSLLDGALKSAVKAALGVYLRGDLSTLQEPLKQVAGDEIVRERLFFNRRG